MTAAQTAPRRRRVGSFILGLIVVFVLLEGLARYAESRGSDALRWYDASTQLRVAEMADRGPVDVVFAGTSMAWQGLVPAIWTAHDPDARTTFNAAMAGGVPEVMEHWLGEVVQPELQPELVVWGLSSLDLSNSYGSDNEARYRDALEARAGLLADVERLAAGYSALVRYRNVLRNPSEWGENRGFAKAAETLGPDGERRDFEADISARRRREIAARVANYAIDPADIEAIHRTVVKLREAGTDVVFVQMPVPERFVGLHPAGSADVAKARNAIDRLGELLDVDVIDGTTGFSDLDFVDFTHLSEPAAADFTERIVRAVSGTTIAEDDPTISDAALLRIATDLVAMADVVRSSLTQKGSRPDSSELWNTITEYGHTRDIWAYHDSGIGFHTVFAGSSMVLAGFDPAVFTAETGVSAYNVGLPSAGPEEFGSYLKTVAIPAANPERVVIGIAPRDFDSLGPADACTGPRARYTRALELREGAFDAVDWFAEVPTKDILFGDPVSHEPQRMTPMHASYREEFSMLGDRSFYPVHNAKELRNEARRTREGLSQYRLCQGRMDNLGLLVADLEARGIEVVVVGLPLSSYLIDPMPGGRAQMEQIMSDARAVVLAAGATHYFDFVDLLEDDMFYDYKHASAAGARELTRALAAGLAAG